LAAAAACSATDRIRFIREHAAVAVHASE